ncbi:YfcE family phosphodiesterase [Patescibacteria group bacterium]|nr:YfcE family phosphodiesterase [Patescibacteria group bacterium]
MKIAICSDSHDNLSNIEKFLKFCEDNDIHRIFHCGDVTEKETREYFLKNFSGEIDFVDGNAEIEVQEKQKRTNRFQKIKKSPVPYLQYEIDKIKIAVCHQRDKAIRLAKSGQFHIVFYGHNHKPWQEKMEKTYLINPGNLAGMFYRASFAVYDTATKKLELNLLEQL